VAVVADAVGPAARGSLLEDVASVDVAVGVEVRDLACALVDGIIKVPEGDHAVAIDVGESALDGGGNFALVDPDVLVQVGVSVIDAGVNDGNDVLEAAGRSVPGFGGVDVGIDGAAGLPGVVQTVE